MCRIVVREHKKLSNGPKIDTIILGIADRKISETMCLNEIEQKTCIAF